MVRRESDRRPRRTTMHGNEIGPASVVTQVGSPESRSEGIVGKNYIDIENDHGETLRYRKHVNGRGLVAHGAKVHPSALVENGAYVEPGVQIAAGVRVGRGAWIESDAVIGPEAHIEPHAHICSGAVIGAGAHIGVRTQWVERPRGGRLAHRGRRDHQRRRSRRHRSTRSSPGRLRLALRGIHHPHVLRNVRVCLVRNGMCFDVERKRREFVSTSKNSKTSILLVVEILRAIPLDVEEFRRAASARNRSAEASPGPWRAEGISAPRRRAREPPRAWIRARTAAASDRRHHRRR